MAYDQLNGKIWYNESNQRPDTLVRFDPETESFQSWAIPPFSDTEVIDSVTRVTRQDAAIYVIDTATNTLVASITPNPPVGPLELLPTHPKIYYFCAAIYVLGYSGIFKIGPEASCPAMGVGEPMKAMTPMIMAPRFLPSLRVTHQLRSLPNLMKGVRKAGLTLAPEVARDDMRVQIRKPVKNDELYEGCREAFKNGWQRVKLYFLCGLPGERHGAC